MIPAPLARRVCRGSLPGLLGLDALEQAPERGPGLVGDGRLHAESRVHARLERVLVAAIGAGGEMRLGECAIGCGRGSVDEPGNEVPGLAMLRRLHGQACAEWD